MRFLSIYVMRRDERIESNQPYYTTLVTHFKKGTGNSIHLINQVIKVKILVILIISISRWCSLQQSSQNSDGLAIIVH